MKKIHLNLKRFDVSVDLGGVNRNSDYYEWASQIIDQVRQPLKNLAEKKDLEFVAYLPEAHLIPALRSRQTTDLLQIGCQSVHYEDVAKEGNFGAFTSLRPATAMKQLGIQNTIIGHFEERKYLGDLLSQVTSDYISVVNQRLNQQIKRATDQNMEVLYCIGESFDQRNQWQEVLKTQLAIGLDGVNLEKVSIAYEPIWAIGPGKTPASPAEIEEVVRYIKTLYPHLDVLYGGGLKKENAKEIAEIDGLDGGLIALTRFTGEIGFYVEEYIEIIHTYLSHLD